MRVGFAVGMTTGVTVGEETVLGVDVGRVGLGGNGVEVAVEVLVEVTVAVTLAVGMGGLVGNGVPVDVAVAVGMGVLVGNGLTMAVAVGTGVLVGMMITAVGVFVDVPPQSGSPGSPQVGEVGVGVHGSPVGSTQPLCAPTLWAAPNWNTSVMDKMIKMNKTTTKLDLENCWRIKISSRNCIWPDYIILVKFVQLITIMVATSSPRSVLLD